MSNNEKHLENREEHKSSEAGLPGVQITKPEDNKVKQRQEMLDASKAFRFSSPENQFSIDTGNGKRVVDNRAFSAYHRSEVHPQVEAEKPEVDHTQPGAPVSRWGEIPDAFYNRVVAAYESLPNSDKEILKKAGVKIVVRPELSGEGGTPAEYVPDENTVYVAVKGKGHGDSYSLTVANSDPEGTLKHEIGHALYRALHVENWSGFQDSLKDEINKVEELEKLGKIPESERDSLAHLLESPTEMFAEMYAMMRGRHTARTDLVAKYFRETYKLMLNEYPD